MRDPSDVVAGWLTKDDGGWSWWAGRDGERYSVGPCATREAAIEEALAACEYEEIEPGRKHHRFFTHSCWPNGGLANISDVAVICICSCGWDSRSGKSHDDYVRELPPFDDNKWQIAIHVLEGQRPEASDMTIDAIDLLERLECGPYEEWNGEDATLFEDVPRAHIDDLGDMLTEALHAWARKHAVRFGSWNFKATRNEERVLLPHPGNGG